MDTKNTIPRNITKRDTTKMKRNPREKPNSPTKGIFPNRPMMIPQTTKNTIIPNRTSGEKTVAFQFFFTYFLASPIE